MNSADLLQICLGVTDGCLDVVYFLYGPHFPCCRTAHSNLVPGVLMQSTYRKVQQRRVNDGYIDDVDNLADAPATNRAPECIKRITMTAQIWATIVMVSGQIMGFHKGGYTMLAFMAVGGYLMHAYRRDIVGEVVLRNAHGKPTTIKYTSPNQSNKSLGFLTNCLGEMGDEFQHRLQQPASQIFCI